MSQAAIMETRCFTERTNADFHAEINGLLTALLVFLQLQIMSFDLFVAQQSKVRVMKYFESVKVAITTVAQLMYFAGQPRPHASPFDPPPLDQIGEMSGRALIEIGLRLLEHISKEQDRVKSTHPSSFTPSVQLSHSITSNTCQIQVDSTKDVNIKTDAIWLSFGVHFIKYLSDFAGVVGHALNEHSVPHEVLEQEQRLKVWLFNDCLLFQHVRSDSFLRVDYM